MVWMASQGCHEQVMSNPLLMCLIVEAMNSVTMDHADDCDCIACRALKGDERALMTIVLACAVGVARA